MHFTTIGLKQCMDCDDEHYNKDLISIHYRIYSIVTAANDDDDDGLLFACLNLG